MGIIMPVELLVAYDEIYSDVDHFKYSTAMFHTIKHNGIVLSDMEIQKILASGEIDFNNINNNEYLNIYNIIHVLHNMKLLNLINFSDSVYDNFAHAIMNPDNDRSKYRRKRLTSTAAMFDKAYRDYYSVLKAWRKEINYRNVAIFDALMDSNIMTIDSFEEMEIYYLYFHDEWDINYNKLIDLFNNFVDTNSNNLQAVAMWHMRYPEIIPQHIKMRLVYNNCVSEFIKAINDVIRSNYYLLDDAVNGGVFANRILITSKAINPNYENLYSTNDFYYNLPNEAKLGVLI